MSRRPAALFALGQLRVRDAGSFVGADHVQAQEISYPSARGSNKTEFKVVGDDYFDDGRVTAWRCCIIENGRVVAETHSFMWE